jgi:hypothetical protein
VHGAWGTGHGAESHSAAPSFAFGVIYSRSLRSAQSRKRVPSFASLSFVIRGREQIED